MALQDREKRLLVVGGVIVILIFAYRWGLTPLLESQDDIKERLAANSVILAKSNTKIAQKDALNAKIKTVAMEISKAEKNLLKGETPALAAAELQKLLKNISSQAKVKISSERILPPIEAEEYQKIPVQITIDCLMSDLKTVLYYIENSPTSLVISETRIRVNDVRDPSQVETNLTVAGLIKRKPDVGAVQKK